MQQYIVFVFILVAVAMLLAATWQCFFNRYRAHRDVVMQNLTEDIEQADQTWQETDSMMDEQVPP